MDWRQKRTLTGIRYLLETAQAEGVDAESCLKGSAIEAASLHNSTAQIEAWQELAVIRNLLGHSNRTGLGLLTGQRYHLTSLGLLGFTMLASRTLLEAFASFSRCQLMALTLCPTRLERDRRGMWLLFDSSVLPRDTRAFVVERGLSGCLQISSELLKRQATPLAVEMTAGDSTHPLNLPWFPYSLSVSAERDGILFSNQELQNPIPQAHLDAQLQGEHWCELQCQEIANPLTGGPTARQVQTVLLSNPEALLSCRTAAQKLGLSERTLHRRQAGEGHSFQQLNEHIKKQLAKRMLGDPRLDLTSIAHRLGYAEAASFSRAFSRWTGYPPSRWQRQNA